MTIHLCSKELVDVSKMFRKISLKKTCMTGRQRGQLAVTIRAHRGARQLLPTVSQGDWAEGRDGIKSTLREGMAAHSPIVGSHPWAPTLPSHIGMQKKGEMWIFS